MNNYDQKMGFCQLIHSLFTIIHTFPLLALHIYTLPHVTLQYLPREWMEYISQPHWCWDWPCGLLWSVQSGKKSQYASFGLRTRETVLFLFTHLCSCPLPQELHAPDRCWSKNDERDTWYKLVPDPKSGAQPTTDRSTPASADHQRVNKKNIPLML